MNSKKTNSTDKRAAEKPMQAVGGRQFVRVKALKLKTGLPESTI